MTKKSSSPRSPRPPHPLHADARAPCADAYGGSNSSASLENSRATSLENSRATQSPRMPKPATPPPHTPATSPSPPRPAQPAQFFPAHAPPPPLPWVTVAAAQPRSTPRPIFLHANAARAALPSTLAQLPASSSTSPFVPPATLHLPSVHTRPVASVLTLAAARAALAAPTSVPRATLAEARTLVRTVGTPIRLDPRTGEPVAPPPAVTAYAFAPDSESAAFPSFDAAQSALRRGAQLAGLMLPPHVLIPGVARWTYIYFLAAATPVAARIFAHAKLIYEDLAIQTIPIFDTARAIDPSAAAGVACRLTREARRLLNRRTPTAVPMPVRVALALSLQAHAHVITQGLARAPSAAATPLNKTWPTSAPAPLLPPSTRSRLPTAAHATNAPGHTAPPRPAPAFTSKAITTNDPDAAMPPPPSPVQTPPLSLERDLPPTSRLLIVPQPPLPLHHFAPLFLLPT